MQLRVESECVSRHCFMSGEGDGLLFLEQTVRKVIVSLAGLGATSTDAVCIWLPVHVFV